MVRPFARASTLSSCSSMPERPPPPYRDSGRIPYGVVFARCPRAGVTDRRRCARHSAGGGRGGRFVTAKQRTVIRRGGGGIFLSVNSNCLRARARTYRHYRLASGPDGGGGRSTLFYIRLRRRRTRPRAHETPVKAGCGGLPAGGRALRTDGTHTSLSPRLKGVRAFVSAAIVRRR